MRKNHYENWIFTSLLFRSYDLKLLLFICNRLQVQKKYMLLCIGLNMWQIKIIFILSLTSVLKQKCLNSETKGQNQADFALCQMEPFNNPGFVVSCFMSKLVIYQQRREQQVYCCGSWRNYSGPALTFLNGAQPTADINVFQQSP